MFVNINDIKNGMTIIIDGKLCVIQEFQHVKPGKGAAIVKIKLKNLKTGSITVESYNSTIKVEKAHIEKKPMTYLYKDGENFVFMDSETYEQVSVPETRLEDEKKYLKEMNHGRSLKNTGSLEKTIFCQNRKEWMLLGKLQIRKIYP